MLLGLDTCGRKHFPFLKNHLWTASNKKTFTWPSCFCCANFSREKENWWEKSFSPIMEGTDVADLQCVSVSRAVVTWKRPSSGVKQDHCLKTDCNYEGIDWYPREMVQHLKKPLTLGDWISKEERSEQMNGTVYVLCNHSKRWGRLPGWETKYRSMRGAAERARLNTIWVLEGPVKVRTIVNVKAGDKDTWRCLSCPTCCRSFEIL